MKRSQSDNLDMLLFCSVYAMSEQGVRESEISIIKYWKRKTVLLTIMKLWFFRSLQQ